MPFQAEQNAGQTGNCGERSSTHLWCALGGEVRRAAPACRVRVHAPSARRCSDRVRTAQGIRLRYSACDAECLTLGTDVKIK